MRFWDGSGFRAIKTQTVPSDFIARLFSKTENNTILLFIIVIHRIFSEPQGKKERSRWGTGKAKAALSPLLGPVASLIFAPLWRPLRSPYGTWTVTALGGCGHGLFAPIMTSPLPVTRLRWQLGLPVLNSQKDLRPESCLGGPSPVWRRGDWPAYGWSPEGQVSSGTRLGLGAHDLQPAGTGGCGQGSPGSQLTAFLLQTIRGRRWARVTHIFSKTERKHVFSPAGKVWTLIQLSQCVLRVSCVPSTRPALRLVEGEFFPSSRTSEEYNSLCGNLSQRRFFHPGE